MITVPPFAAYAGQPNSVQLILSRHDGADPILDLDDPLSVTVSFGENLNDPIPLVANLEPGGDGIQGDYRAWFIPTEAGSYTFHFIGEIDGTEIDKAFIAGPTTFAEVEDPAGAPSPSVRSPRTTSLRRGSKKTPRGRKRLSRKRPTPRSVRTMPRPMPRAGHRRPARSSSSE